MKKTILTTTFLVAGMIGVLAQGTVNFSNFGTSFTDGIDRRVYVDEVGGNPVTDPTWRAQLLENGAPVGAAANFIGSFAPGQWAFGNRTLSVPAGTPTTLAVQILNASGAVLATSDTFSYSAPTGATPPPTDFLMTNFRAFAVPEPSTIALGVLGLGALLLFRRRK
jgi:hypothetical protein